MQEQQQQQQTNKPQRGGPWGSAYMLCNIHCMCFLPWLRCWVGRETYGWPAFQALIAMIFFACLAPAPPMFLYLAIWILFLLRRRCETWRMLRKGAVVHSRDQGYPWLAMKIPLVWSEKTAVGIVEPMIVMIMGMFLCYASVPMGMFFFTGFVTMTLRNAIEGELMRKRVQRMTDGAIEQRYLSDRLRGRI